MFWLINENGAYGARSGLPTVAHEIIVGMFKGGKSSNIAAACEYGGTLMSCYMHTNVFRRLAIFQPSAKFPFE
jgi:hypothetical protein